MKSQLHFCTFTGLFSIQANPQLLMLPNELILQILEYLYIQDLFALACTSKQIRPLVQERVFAITEAQYTEYGGDLSIKNDITLLKEAYRWLHPNYQEPKFSVGQEVIMPGSFIIHGPYALNILKVEEIRQTKQGSYQIKLKSSVNQNSKSCWVSESSYTKYVP